MLYHNRGEARFEDVSERSRHHESQWHLRPRREHARLRRRRLDRRSTSPTTRTRARCTATTTTAPSPTSASPPAAPTARTASRRPAWASPSATTITTAPWTSFKTNFAGDTIDALPQHRPRLCEDRTFAAGHRPATPAGSAGAPASSTSTTTAGSTCSWPTATSIPRWTSSQTEAAYQQRKVVYRNLRNGRFEDITEALGAPVTEPKAGTRRGLRRLRQRRRRWTSWSTTFTTRRTSSGSDADPSNALDDVAAGRHALEPQTRSARASRSSAANCAWWQEVRGGGSYISQNDLRVHFGLGAAERRRARSRCAGRTGGEESWSGLTVDRFIELVKAKAKAKPAGRNRDEHCSCLAVAVAGGLGLAQRSALVTNAADDARALIDAGRAKAAVALLTRARRHRSRGAGAARRRPLPCGRPARGDRACCARRSRALATFGKRAARGRAGARPRALPRPVASPRRSRISRRRSARAPESTELALRARHGLRADATTRASARGAWARAFGVAAGFRRRASRHRADDDPRSSFEDAGRRRTEAARCRSTRSCRRRTSCWARSRSSAAASTRRSRCYSRSSRSTRQTPWRSTGSATRTCARAGWDEAIAALQRSALDQPVLQRPLHPAGQRVHANGDLAAAEGMLRRAIELRPEQPRRRTTCSAQLLQRLGTDEEAAREFAIAERAAGPRPGNRQ